MSIRHRLNIIVFILVAALLVALGVLGLDGWQAIGRIEEQQSRLARMQTYWDVAATAARRPDDAAATLARAREIVESAPTEAARADAAALAQVAEQGTPLKVLQRIRGKLPDVAQPIGSQAGGNGSESDLTRLVAQQLPELLWRVATLRGNGYELAARERLGPADRMLFLVNAGQFKAAADSIDGSLRQLEAANPNDTALNAAGARYTRANGDFQSTAAKLAWTVNVTADDAAAAMRPQALDDPYRGLIEAALGLGEVARATIARRIEIHLQERAWAITALVACGLLATLLAIHLAVSMSASIVRAIARLERRIRALADSEAGDIENAPLSEATGGGELARIARAILYYRDRVAERVAAAAQDEKRRELELMFEGNPLPLLLHEPGCGRIIGVNRTAVEHYGYDRDTFLERRVADLEAPPADRPAHDDDAPETVCHLKADGEIIEVLPFERGVRHDGRDVRLTTIVDITARRRAENRLAFLAHFDALTNLANRVLLQQRLNEEVARGVGDADYGFALLCLDLDRFKTVNDTLGHDAGDQVLRAVATRLCNLAGAGDTVARLGGDEFTILVCGPRGHARAQAIARAACAALAEPYLVDGARLVLGGSVGLATYPAHGSGTDELMKHADLALNHAKASGRGMVCTFEPFMDEDLRRRQTLEADLREALEHGRFELYYQPLIDMKTSAVSGFEALLRWHDPVRGMVSPAEFIPVAEEVGLIEEIGTWVLKEACREVATWPNRVKIAVNVSSNQFRSGLLGKAVQAALGDSGLEPDRLELEITESVLLNDSAATLETLHEIRKLGVRIAMDDFGTGYSSLSYLRSFPFDKVKIDRSFISDLGNTSEANAIIRAIAGLSSELGMTTTAEGIETEDQLRHIRAHGCSEAQGFLTGRPAPAAQARLFAEGHAEALSTLLERMKTPGPARRAAARDVA